MSCGPTVTIADILELREDGLTEEEIWSILYHTVQVLQDLFLSDELTSVNSVPLVSPDTLGICSRGRVFITIVSHLDADREVFAAPEYMIGAKPDWEKMWVYSLGKTLLSSLKRAVAPTSSLLEVLQFMTWKEPFKRCSLMALINKLFEHCQRNTPMRPFSYSVMNMYGEVFGAPPAPECLESPAATGATNIKQKTIPLEEYESRKLVGQAYESMSEDRVGCDGPESGNSCGSKGSNPVQRGPSRLYRGPVFAETYDNRNARYFPGDAYTGPEFVVRFMEPPRILYMNVKASRRKILTVVLLTGEKIEIVCDPNDGIVCGKVFEIVVEATRLEDNFIFGLACLMNGEFVFVPPETTLSEVAPSAWKNEKHLGEFKFFLYVRVKFFLPNLRGLKSPVTKHMLYLQLRRSLLEQQIKCQLEDLLTLGGLALQAEFSNFDEKEHGTRSYFLVEHYLPEELVHGRESQLEHRLQQIHKSRSGVERVKAEELFIYQVQRLPEYGSHHYAALWMRKSVVVPMWVSVSPQGMYLCEKKNTIVQRKIHEAFLWKNIEHFSYNDNYFHLVPQRVGGQKMPHYKLRMDPKKSFFLFRLAAFHHRFFTKLRIQLQSLEALSQEFNLMETQKSIISARMVEPGRAAHTPSIFSRQNQVEKLDGFSDEKNQKQSDVRKRVSTIHSSQMEVPNEGGRKCLFLRDFDDPMDAYVIDSSIKCPDEHFTFDLQESVPMDLESKLAACTWEEERVLTKVSLTKDKYGRFGLEVVEGSNGGIFIANLLKNKAGNGAASVGKGDQLLAVNGICLLNLRYSQALNILRSAGNQMEILLSQTSKRKPN